MFFHFRGRGKKSPAAADAFCGRCGKFAAANAFVKRHAQVSVDWF
jgi:hypothetical protein